MSFEDTTADPAPVDDIRSALLSAVAEHDPADTPAPQIDAEAAPEEKPARARDETGRFAKKEETEAPVTEEKPAEEATTEQPTEKPATKEPPANWAKTDKETFGKMPAEAQDFLLRRHAEMEADYTRKTQQVAHLQREYGPVDQMFAPYENDLRASGFTKGTLIQAWMNVERELKEGRGVGIVKSLVDNYKLDRAGVAQALGLTVPQPGAGVEQPAAPNQPQAQLPPELAAKIRELDEWKAIQQREQQNRVQAEHNAAASRVMNTIEQFKAAADTAGALLHPHFDEVEAQMTAIAHAARIAGQPVPELKDLYDQAVWANPSTRAKAIEAQRAADEAQRAADDAKRQKEARAKAESARRAASSVTGAPSPGQSGSAQTRSGAGSLRDDLLAAVSDHDAA